MTDHVGGWVGGWVTDYVGGWVGGWWMDGSMDGWMGD